MFQTAEQLENWDDAQGKKVIYAFVGFSAGKAGQYDVAELALKKAIELDPKYARPFIGMANLNYMRALLPFEKSKNPDDIDNALLENCFSYLDLAVQAPEKPPLAEVDTKIHFSRGQCLMLKAYARLIPSLEPAYNEFQLVIQAYGDGKNPRVRELAAESHARVGMIYRLTGQNEKAISEYQATVNLLYDYPERQKLYQESIEEITKDIPTP
jgi:tetratricopeptide (TPR) repeat protein